MSPEPIERARSALFAPAVRPDLVRKLGRHGADLVVIDCEDASPPDAKHDARATAAEAGAQLAAAGVRVSVRINAHGSPWWSDDLAEALTGALTAVVVPKVDSIEGLDAIAAGLLASGHSTLGIIAGIETALGVADARALLAHRQVVGAYFGAEDFVADMGGTRTSGNAEVLHARSATVLAGRLAAIPVLDQVVTEFANSERFSWEAAEARALGYAGKLCIHPGQVALANEAFTPSAGELDRARRLLAAYDEAMGAGVGAIAFEGEMIDEPLARQARRLLAQAP